MAHFGWEARAAGCLVGTDMFVFRSAKNRYQKNADLNVNASAIATLPRRPRYPPIAILRPGS